MLGPSDPARGMVSLSLTLQLGFSAEGRGCLQEEGHSMLSTGEPVTVLLNHGQSSRLGWPKHGLMWKEKIVTS